MCDKIQGVKVPPGPKASEKNRSAIRAYPDSFGWKTVGEVGHVTGPEERRAVEQVQVLVAGHRPPSWVGETVPVSCYLTRYRSDTSSTSSRTASARAHSVSVTTSGGARWRRLKWA